MLFSIYSMATRGILHRPKDAEYAAFRIAGTPSVQSQQNGMVR
jgi:hypothetical protein